MITAADYALIKNLEITTRKLISGPLLADARSTLKGSGFEFHQLRDYEQGDDVRFIDWKSSTRSNKMLVRQYLEDRNRVVYVVVDMSASTQYGTLRVRKNDLIKQLAALLSFVSLHRKDSVGLILFTDRVEKIIPPRSSRAHVYALVNTLMSFAPQNRTTNLSAPLDYLLRLRGQKGLVCFVSDFLGGYDQSALSLVARHHDLLAFRCLDEREIDFPAVGTLLMQDSETLEIKEIEGDGKTISAALHYWHKHQKEQLTSAKLDCLDLVVGKPFAGDLVRFLRTRLYG